MNRLQQTRRQGFGYVYPNQVQNSIITATPRRSNYGVITKSFDQNSNDMEGEGIMDIARGIYEKGKAAGRYIYGKRDLIKKAGTAAVDFYGSETGKALQNLLPSSDETARDGFSGERHAILQLPNGKYGVANYMGPGTQVVKRLKRGDPPRTLSDKTAMRHDIDYAIAAGMKNKDAQIKAIREADKRMVRNLDRIAREKGDAQKNIFQGRRLIQGKMAAEDVGLMAKGSFGGDLKPISDEDRIILMSNRARLGQEGFGNLPAQQLKLKLLKQHSRKGKKGRGLNPAGGYVLNQKQRKGVEKICRECVMRGEGVKDMMKKAVGYLKPVVKTVGPVLVKEIILPMAKKAIKAKLGMTGDGLNPAGGRISMGKSYGTSKGHKMKGGFFFLLPALVGAVSSAVSAAAGAAALGAAGYVGQYAAKKIIGSGKMKGRGVAEVAQKVSKVLKDKQGLIVKAAEMTKVLPKDLPKQVLDKAQTALKVIQQTSGNQPPKEKILGVVKMLIPHVREAFHSKMEKKMGGRGLKLSGQGFDAKVFSIVKKNL